MNAAARVRSNVACPRLRTRAGCKNGSSTAALCSSHSQSLRTRSRGVIRGSTPGRWRKQDWVAPSACCRFFSGRGLQEDANGTSSSTPTSEPTSASTATHAATTTADEELAKPQRQQSQGDAAPPSSSNSSSTSSSSRTLQRNLSRKDHYTSTVYYPPPPVQRTLSSGSSSINQVVEYLQSFNQKPLQANWFQSLGLAEFSSRELKERFDELDVDEDGYLSEKDLKDLVAKYHAKWYPPRQSAMGGNVSRLNLTEKEQRKMEEREERRRLRMERRILEMFRSVGVGSRESSDSGSYSLHQNGNGASTSTGNAPNTSGTTTATPTRSKLESFDPSTTTSAPPLLGSMGSTEKQQENERQREFRISREQWVRTMRALAEKVDHRIYPIAVSCFMTGATLGILTPVIPFLSEKLQLTKAQFGLYVASFAATKIFANIPAAFLVERYGRKPFFVFPTGVVGIAFGSLAFATSFEQMCLSRMLVGACVAALTSSASMSMMDLGTKLNMTRTIAPVGIAFNAGIAIGPAIGGLLVSKLGMEPTFLLVGATFLGLMVANHFVIVETAPKLLKSVSLKRQIQEAVSLWGSMWRENANLKHLLKLNSAFWVSSAGGHATILPLILIGPQFGLDVGQTGLVFAGMAFIQVLAGSPLALLCDTVGKEKVLVGGTLVLSVAMGLLPLTAAAVAPAALGGDGLVRAVSSIPGSSSTTLASASAAGLATSIAAATATTTTIGAASTSQLEDAAGEAVVDAIAAVSTTTATGVLPPSAICLFALMGLGSAAFGAAPNSIVSDLVSQEKRAQALSMLRTSSDLGYLTGATLTGYFAETMSPEYALVALSGLLLTNTGVYHRAQMRGGGYRKPTISLRDKVEKMWAGWRWRKRFFRRSG